MTSQRKSAERLRALRRRPEIAALARVAKRRGIDAWIVGGAPRDAVLGFASPEIDVAVARDAESLAADLEREGLGRAVFLSRDRPGPRVFRVAGRRPLDLAELEGGSIEADLARRDFTANAVAVDISSGAVVDPFGGLRDLARRRLTGVRPGNLAQDPLRILRAARFYATLGLVPDAGVLEASRQAAGLFGRAAPERVGGELARLLGSPRAAPALSWAARAGILGPSLGREPGGSAAAVARALGALDAPSISRRPPAERRRMRLALVALRLGLDAAGARAWLHERRWAREEARESAALCGLVLASRRLASRGPHARRGAFAWILEAERDGLLDDATRLLSRLGAADRRRAAALRRLARCPRPKVRVSGGDVVRWLGIPPGPRVGERLSAVRVAAAMGEVRSRREARNWLTGQVPERP
ncbi:MAG TPA: hypothetical protein VMN82_17025 [Thermoanaerobaculia bacterium]|nr:hypothetical protein [Thermoanaerobaculia bacterium]